jgi:diacylglycerol kinase (ATP)
MKTMEVTLIGNPSSGGADGSDLHRAAGLLRGFGTRVDLRPTEGPGHATELAREAGERRVVVAGGDGTINEAINGLSPGAELAILPVGTANVLARELEIPFPLEDSCRRAISGEVRSIDLGVATSASGEERRFSCMAGVGFDARVVEAVSPRSKRYLKGAAFPLAAAGVYLKGGFPLARFSAGGKTHRARFAVVANARRYGGELRVVEGASLTSGTLEVVLVEKVGHLLRPALLAKILTRRPLDRYATSFCAKELYATSAERVPVQLDGEPWGELPVSFSVEPRALSVVC